MTKGVDVSSYQGIIDWSKAKAAGVDFAILRSILKSGKLDSSFNRNYDGAKAVGLPVGVYKYSYALNVAEAKAEAEAVIKAMSGRVFELGVWLDLEDKTQRALSKSQLTAIIDTFKSVIEKAGYSFGIYCNLDWYKNVIEVDKFNCPYWVARYPSDKPMTLDQDANTKYKPAIRHTLWGWQYSSKGQVNGIGGNCDINECYVELGAVEPPQVAETEEGYDMPTIRYGYKGKAVKIWQIIVGVEPDGIFGHNTDAATRVFQVNNNLSVDGIVGVNSWRAGLESV